MTDSIAECIAVFQVLKENTSVKHIAFSMLFKRYYTERSALAAAEYVESSKTLQTMDFSVGLYQFYRPGNFQENAVSISFSHARSLVIRPCRNLSSMLRASDSPAWLFENF
jgi:hypothetical protein